MSEHSVAASYITINCVMQRPTEEPTPIKNENESRDETKQQKRQQKIKREIRAAAVLGIIVLSFAICWMPLHILNTVHRYD